MTCWHCSKRLAEGVRICAFCRADQRTPGQKPRAAKSLTEQQKAVPPTRRRVSMGSRSLPSWPWWVLALVVVATAVTIWALRPVKAPLDTLTLAQADRPCATEPRCLVVYLGPWAPTSERAIATARRVAAEEAGAIGVAVVIGADDPEIMEQFARTVGLPGWLDPQDALVRALELETSPTFLLLDQAGSIERRVDGVFFPYDYHREKLGL